MTVDSVGITDAGVTANVGVSAKVGEVSMDVGSAGTRAAFRTWRMDWNRT